MITYNRQFAKDAFYRFIPTSNEPGGYVSSSLFCDLNGRFLSPLAQFLPVSRQLLLRHLDPAFCMDALECLAADGFQG